MEDFETTTSDDNLSTETPILDTDKLKDSLIPETSVSTSSATTINSETPNTPPIVKQKFPKLPATAGKPLK